MFQDRATLPPREGILVEGGWRVAHAFNSSLPGWLVLVPVEHVGSLDELPPAAAAEMGLLLHRCSRALREVTGCAKAYFMFFAEAEGFTHLHVHIVPRMATFTAEQQGPRVFSFLGGDEGGRLSPDELDAIALLLRVALADT